MSVTTLIPPTTCRADRSAPKCWDERTLPGGGQVFANLSGDVVEIHLAGELDACDRYALCDVLTDVALQRDGRPVHIVANDVEFVDLPILRLVDKVRRQLRRSGGSLRLTGLRGSSAVAWTLVAGPTRPSRGVLDESLTVDGDPAGTVGR